MGGPGNSTFTRELMESVKLEGNVYDPDSVTPAGTTMSSKTKSWWTKLLYSWGSSGVVQVLVHRLDFEYFCVELVCKPLDGRDFQKKSQHSNSLFIYEHRWHLCHIIPRDMW